MVFDTIEAEANDLRVHVALCAQRHAEVMRHVEKIPGMIELSDTKTEAVLDAVAGLTRRVSWLERAGYAVATVVLTAVGAGALLVWEKLWPLLVQAATQASQ